MAAAVLEVAAPGSCGRCTAARARRPPGSRTVRSPSCAGTGRCRRRSRRAPRTTGWPSGCEKALRPRIAAVGRRAAGQRSKRSGSLKSVVGARIAARCSARHRGQRGHDGVRTPRRRAPSAPMTAACRSTPAARALADLLEHRLGIVEAVGAFELERAEIERARPPARSSWSAPAGRRSPPATRALPSGLSSPIIWS